MSDKSVINHVEIKDLVTKQKVSTYLDAFGLTKNLTEQEQMQFIEVATSMQLNPFKREIYCVAYGKGEYRNLSIMTGYEVYIKRAERIGLMNGWKTWIEGTGKDLRAVIEIHRKDWSQPFIHEVFYAEAVQYKKDGVTVNKFWKKMPRFQLKKVAISQGFRLCFPDELSGMPYANEELPEEMATENVTPDKNKTTTQKPPSGKKPKDVGEKIMSRWVQIKAIEKVMASDVFTTEEKNLVLNAIPKTKHLEQILESWQKKLAERSKPVNNELKGMEPELDKIMDGVKEADKSVAKTGKESMEIF